MAADPIAARMQRATEAILEAENLTDGLQDAEAETLLNWGLARVEAEVKATAGLDNAAAAARIDAGVAAVRRVMRRINSLVAGRADVEDEELADGLRALVQAAPDLPSAFSADPSLAAGLEAGSGGRAVDRTKRRKQGRSQQMDLDEAITALVERHYKLSDAEMLQRLLALVDAAGRRP